MVPFEEFKKLELRVAEIETVTEHPNADRLYVLGIRVGETRKTIVAGIRNHYKTEELLGKRIVVVDNLEPVTLRGVESQGMLLAASDEVSGALTLIIPERDIVSGAKVR